MDLYYLQVCFKTSVFHKGVSILQIQIRFKIFFGDILLNIKAMKVRHLNEYSSFSVPKLEQYYTPKLCLSEEGLSIRQCDGRSIHPFHGQQLFL